MSTTNIQTLIKLIHYHFYTMYEWTKYVQSKKKLQKNLKIYRNFEILNLLITI